MSHSLSISICSETYLEVNNYLTNKTITNVIATIYGSVEPGQSVCADPTTQLQLSVASLSLSDRYVLLGNHHDAWTFGAVDPNSGTAVLMELARALSDLRSKSQSPSTGSHTPSLSLSLSLSLEWRPGRTILLCSWDAEEYGLIGSYEWTEVLYMCSQLMAGQ